MLVSRFRQKILQVFQVMAKKSLKFETINLLRWDENSNYRGKGYFF